VGAAAGGGGRGTASAGGGGGGKEVGGREGMAFPHGLGGCW
jgi:hypothetical protein